VRSRHRSVVVEVLERNCRELFPAERSISEAGSVQPVECVVHRLPERSNAYLASANDKYAIQLSAPVTIACVS
jgi:hypothetical protein